eukprot:9485334-Pyramimonas_sp.AAC.1
MASFECPTVWLAVVRPRRRARPLEGHGAALVCVVLVVADVRAVVAVAVVLADLGVAALALGLVVVVGAALVLERVPGVASTRDVGAATLVLRLGEGRIVAVIDGRIG